MTVKRLLLAATGACALVLALLAVPALSARPYVPEPVEFDLTPGSPAVRASGGATISEPIRTPRRFNLAGLRWRRGGDPHVSVRTRQAEGGWSRWTELESDGADGPDPGSREPRPETTTNPVWTGEADWIQYRTRRRVSGLKLHFVNVRGTATEGDRLRTTVRRAASSAVISASRLVGSADAAEAQPRIVSRGEWGASQCPPRAGPAHGEVKAAFIHHTVNPNDYTRAEAPSIVLGICRFHRNSNGWNDIGYNFLVDRFGTIYEGRAGGITKAVVGAQAQGYNSQSTGIANLGTFTDVPQTQAALHAIARLIRWKLPLHGVPTSGSTTLTSAGGSTNRFPAGRDVSVQRVIGHRDTGSTECPGNKLYDQLPALRALVGGAVPDGNGTLLGVKLSKQSVAPGKTLQMSGTLRRVDRARTRLPAKTVQIQRKLGRRWSTLRTVSTDSRGRYAVVLRGSRNRRVRARFPGAGVLAASASRAPLLGVRAHVQVPPVASGARTDRTVRVAGRVRPRKRRVYQVLQRRRAGRFATIGVRGLSTTRSGRFKGSFVAATKGIYRVYVRTKRDGRNVASKSRRYVVTVGRRR